MKCRFCNTELEYEFIDLNNAPPTNSFLNKEQLNEPEVFFPLKVFICHNCFLVQIDEYKKSDEIFSSDYIYHSSYSTSWLKHCKDYVDMMCNRFNFDKNSFVVEIASNDGYLLQYFNEKEITVLGIEPAFETAEVARKKGIQTITEFFGKDFAKDFIKEWEKPNLVLGNNVLAHVSDINDFVEGIKIILKDDGIFTFEFPHLMQLVENNQFDTIYQEHFSYLSFYTIYKIFLKYELQLFDVEEIPTHGGSLRIYGKHIESENNAITDNVKNLLDKEEKIGMQTLKYYEDFKNRVQNIKYGTLQFLLSLKQENKKVILYSASAKGNTFLNYIGIKKDLIEFAVDLSPHKQNKYLPGSHILVQREKIIKDIKPDYIIISAWNIKDEIIEQLNYVKEWGCKFVTCIPQLQIVE